MSPTARTAEPPEGPLAPAFSCFPVGTASGRLTLMLVGELDLVTADRARVAVRRALDETPRLTSDLGDVWFVDLSGLRVLIDASVQATLAGGHLVISNCPPIVPRMLRVLGLRDTLDVRAVPRSAAQSHGCATVRRHVS
jgi:anti-sigma B factor antagonist